MRGLLIPCVDLPEIIVNDNLEESKIHVFGSSQLLISTFDGTSNYYHLPQDEYNIFPVNKIATILKRLYSNNYTSFVRGDILVYSSADGFPNIIDSNVRFDFVQQLILYMDHFYDYR